MPHEAYLLRQAPSLYRELSIVEFLDVTNSIYPSAGMKGCDVKANVY